MEKITIKDVWPGAISNGLCSECQCCGHLPYIDYSVEDAFWAKVVPQKMKLGVICFRCLDEMAAGNGEDVAAHLIRFQFTGKGKTIEMTPSRVFYYPQQSDTI